FFQAEDGIRDGHVTGVQTCALPIYLALRERKRQAISLLHAEPLAVFLPYGGDRWFVDYAWITSTLRHLFYGINPSDQNFKGEARSEERRVGKESRSESARNQEE